MRVQRSLHYQHGLQGIHLIPLADILLLCFSFFTLISPLAIATSLDLDIPQAVASAAIEEDNLVIVISAEDIIYLNNQIVTERQLRLELAKRKNNTVLLKADRRASLDRLINIWDICRQLGVTHINLATN